MVKSFPNVPSADKKPDGRSFLGSGFGVVELRRIRFSMRMNNGWKGVAIAVGLMLPVWSSAVVVFFETEDRARIEAGYSGDGNHGVVLAHGGCLRRKVGMIRSRY